MTHRGVNVRSRISHTWKTKNLFLPPATKLRQGNVFTPVCHSVHRESVYQPPLGRHPWADTPQADTPCADTPAPLPSRCWDTHPPWQTPPGQTSPSDQTPPWADTPSWADTPWTHSPGQTSPAQCMLGYTPLHSAGWDTVNKRAIRILLECRLVGKIFAENCMEMKEIGRGEECPCTPLDPPFLFVKYVT